VATSRSIVSASARRASPEKASGVRRQAIRSCHKLGLEQIGLWQLHRIDPKVPREAQFAAVKALLDDGIIKHAGLSEVSIADIKAASQVFPVATSQNRYNIVDRGSEDVLEYCDQHGIGFIPWYPLAAGELAKSGSILDRVAKAHGATPGTDRARLAAQTQPHYAAHSRHVEGEAPRGECRGGEHQAHC
jgi:pyridoxine 4-dehydrogenase